MEEPTYNSIAVYHEDYKRLKIRLQKRKGITMMGLIHEILDKTEPPLRDSRGAFTTKEDK